MDEVLLHPAWRNALQSFLDGRFPYGHLLTRDWLYEQFQIERPCFSTPHGVAQRAELRFVEEFTSLRQALLEDHQIDLQTKNGVGYVVVAPGDQTGLALSDGIVAVRKALRRATTRATNVRIDELTPEQQKANADALAKLATVKVALRRGRLLLAAE